MQTQGSGIDPISQMIGALGAQVTNLSAQMSDLRAEIMVNRTEADKRWTRLDESIEKIWVEYRNVKHMERSMEQSSIAIDARLKGLDKRIEEMANSHDQRIRAMEDSAVEWRVKAGLLIAGGSIAGTILLYLIQALIRKFIG